MSATDPERTLEISRFESMMNAMKIEIITPGDDEYKDLDARLVAFNTSNTDWDADVFVVIVRSPDGILVGGTRSVVRMGAAEVRALWLDEDQRGLGLGKQIMRRVEAEVAERGAKRVLLDTYSFQARDFYNQLGYECFGTFNYPNGVQRYYMSKNL